MRDGCEENQNCTNKIQNNNEFPNAVKVKGITFNSENDEIVKNQNCMNKIQNIHEFPKLVKEKDSKFNLENVEIVNDV